jgi:hypothetical protein
MFVLRKAYVIGERREAAKEEHIDRNNRGWQPDPANP